MVCDEDWDRGLSREGISRRRLAACGLIDFVDAIRGHIDTDEALSMFVPGMGARSAPVSFFGRRCAATRMPTFHAAGIQDVATARAPPSKAASSTWSA